jgi:hypothetical protein
MPQETHDQQEAQPTGVPPAGAATTGQAGLLVVVIAGAVFMFALSAFCWWVATRASRPAAPAAAVRTVADTIPAAAAAPAPAGGLPDAPPVPAEAADVVQPGLSLTFARAGTDPTTSSDTRTARFVSLYVPAGTPPTPFLDAGPFVAVWEGALNMRLRDTYLFSAQGNGKLTVTIGGQPAFAAAGDDLS